MRTMPTFHAATPLAALGAELYCDEVARLSRIRPQPAGPQAQVCFQHQADLPPEGYRLQADRRRARIWAADALGFAYGAGALLAAGLEAGCLQLPTLSETSSPQSPLRGMWFANHRQSNSYYSWLAEDWERYVRSLMLWGLNCLGAYPAHMATWPGVVPWGPNAGFESPARQAEWESFWQTQLDVCQLAGRLGLRYYIWVPPNDIWPGQLTPEIFRGGDNACPSTPLGRQLILQDREELFRRLPRVDVLFVPSHDNGGCPCPQCTPWVDVYLPLVRDQAEICRRYHPQAQVWLSTQHLSRAENEVLFAYLRRDQGSWVNGVAFGPWSVPVSEIRAGVPEHLPIINYPDLTHALRCQNPIRGLDYFTSKVFERDGPTSRPRDMERIYRAISPYAAGSVPYTEGVHDDLNKVIWLQLGWDQERPVRTVVERYCRRWFGTAQAKQAADLMYDLEANWSRPLAGNEQVPAVAERLQALVDSLGPGADWRCHMFLVRALIEQYAQAKLAQDQALEADCCRQLREAPPDRLRALIPSALQELRSGMAQPPHLPWRDRIMQVAGRLAQVPSLRIDAARRLDFPMNDLAWLSNRLQRALELPDSDLPREVAAVLGWEHPGPGGYYDDGGNPAREPHLVLGEDYTMEAMDPTIRHSQTRFAYNFADTPGVIFEYQGLDPQAAYRVRVTYLTTGRMAGNVELVAGDQGQYQVHGPLDMPRHTPQQFEFPLPPAAYADGRLRLSFRSGGQGRGPLVPELWVIKG